MSTLSAGLKVGDVAPAVPQPTNRRRRLVGAAVVLMLALTGAVTAEVVSSRHAAAQALDSAQASSVSARAALPEALSAARTVLDGSQDSAGADEVRPQLVAAIASAETLLAATPTNDVDALERDAETALSAASALSTATSAVADAQAVGELHEAQAAFDAAHSSLGASIDSAAAVLAGSDGKVTDPAVRDSLAAAIATAQAALTAPTVTAGDLEATRAATAALTSSSTAAATAGGALAAAVATVTDAQVTWQAEQDRAAEQAAADAAAAAAAKSTPAKSKSTTPSPTKASPSTTSKASSGVKVGDQRDGGTVVKVDGDNYWVETFTPAPDRCGDEFGNTWDC